MKKGRIYKSPEVMLGRRVAHHSPATLSTSPMRSPTADELAALLLKEALAKGENKGSAKAQGKALGMGIEALTGEELGYVALLL